MRRSCTKGFASPNGPRPSAAKASTAPRENTSDAGPVSAPSACSGDMNAGVPTSAPAALSWAVSVAREIPMSIRRGPSPASSTFAGVTSRCTRPAAWTAASAAASSAARTCTDGGGSGPASATARSSATPCTYSVASHGTGASGSAASTAAVPRLRTRMLSATSRRNRSRKAGSEANRRWTTLTAASSRYGPTPR